MKLISTYFLCFLNLSLFSQSTEKIYLSGVDSKHTVQWDFFCTDGRKSNVWSKIDVPSCWELQGFGNYNYGRDYKTNGKNSRFNDEKGMYKYSFHVPATWKGRRVQIIFDGSMTDTDVKINGVSAGSIHKGSFYRFKYDISSLLKYNSANTLEVTVSKMSDDASVNNAERLADYWVFGGIFRPVFLEADPIAHMERVGIDAKHDGSFSLHVLTEGLKTNATINYRILDQQGKLIYKSSSSIKAGDSLVKINAQLNNIKQWTAESPDLYVAKFELMDAKGKKLHELHKKFGFRTIEVRRGMGVYVNNAQVKFKGVNRHCFWPETGRALSFDQQLQDVKLLKEMNMNAVRCSHYPPDEYFLELCDSLGIYVIDELAGWQKAYSTKAGTPLVKEMVLRDMNHPSIVFWANGNEGGTNKELDHLFSDWDIQKRTVIHPHHRPGNDFNGIDCNHYEDYNSTKKILQDSLIYMPTEFLHAQDDGAGGASMEDMWELHWNAQRSAGGFIWAFADEAVMRTDMNNMLDANGLNANDGILGPHREKEGSYYALREIFSPVRIKLHSLLGNDFTGSVQVENRFYHTDLSKCSYKWELVDFTSPFQATAGYQVNAIGGNVFPAAKTKETIQIDLGLPANYSSSDALIIKAYDPQGRELCKWVGKLKSNDVIAKSIMMQKNDQSSITETDSTLSLSAADITLVLDKKTGNLNGTKNKTNDFVLSFNGGPVLTSGNTVVKNHTIHQQGVDKSVTYTCEGDMKSFTWTIHANGWATLQYTYELNGDYPFAGVSFNYPENYMLYAKWLGKGPSRQWKNRLAGTPISVWQNMNNNTQTGYAPNVYPEFKGYYGDISWMELSTVEGKIYVATDEQDLFVRLFDFKGLTSTGKIYPQLPSGDISFLDCIPAIGSKLAMGVTGNAAVYGPLGELNHLKGQKNRTLHFYFGVPKTSDKKETYSRPIIDNVF